MIEKTRTDLDRGAQLHALLDAAKTTFAELGFTSEEVAEAMHIYALTWLTNLLGTKRTANYMARVAEKLGEAAAAETIN